jgi:hypothetical protein
MAPGDENWQNITDIELLKLAVLLHWLVGKLKYRKPTAVQPL